MLWNCQFLKVIDGCLPNLFTWKKVTNQIIPISAKEEEERKQTIIPTPLEPSHSPQKKNNKKNKIIKEYPNELRSSKNVIV